MTRLPCSGACLEVTVHFTGEMIVQSMKDYLNNKINMQGFINYLNHKLECSIDRAKRDVDVLIIQTVASVRIKDTYYIMLI